jgi:hypothetical protein
MSAPGLSEAQVNALYQQYLGRAPEAGVAAQWAAAGGAKESDLANALGTSQEFGMRAMADPTRVFTPGNPNAPTGARGNLTQDQLNATYREVLGRDAPTSDLAAWNNVGGSINDYRNALIATPEFADRYGEARRSMSPDDPRLNPAGFDPIAARQGPAFQPPPGTQPATRPPMAQPGGMTGRGYQDPSLQDHRDLLGWKNPPDWTPRNTGRTGGQRDWLGGMLGQLFGGGNTDAFNFMANGGFASPDALYRMPGSGSRRNNQFTDLFGGGAGQFGSGAMGGQQTNAMSNPLSASPFGRNFSTRQMGIPARTMI